MDELVVRVGPYRFQITLTSKTRMAEGGKRAILRAARGALAGIPAEVRRKKLRTGRTYALHLCLVSQAEMKKLNREWRGKNKVTDVLSFSRLEGVDTPHPEIGDVILCSARAREQAADWGNTLPDELARLTVHGVLHLFGYDHERSARAEHIMFRLQDHILFKLPR